MRDVFAMWRDPRLVALTAVIAALYMTALIPFKGFVIVPGFTEVRPANVLPVAFGLLFGPAAAWGSAFGNLFSDAFGGTLSVGSVFGFLGNFFSSYAAYKLWGNLGRLSSGAEPRMRSLHQVLEFWAVSLVAAAGTAAIIAWGLEVLGLFPFPVFATIIFVNDFLAAAVIGPPVLYLLYPSAEEVGVRYVDLVGDAGLETPPARQRRVAATGLATVSVAWLLAGLGVGALLQGVPLVMPGVPEPGTGGSTVQILLGAVGFLLLLGFSALTGRVPRWLPGADARTS